MSAPSPASASPPEEPAVNAASPEAAEADSRRNFWAWVFYQFFYRTGWQFKMEATLMAGIVSYLAPAPWVMGLFTALNTLCRNLSPLVAAPLTDRIPSKRRALLLFWGGAVLTWAALTVQLWLPGADNRAFTIWYFGACYSLFFAWLGASSVAQGALLGKIIPAEKRGAAMANGMTLSGVVNTVAILVIFRLVQGGGFPEPRNYALAFTMTVLFFTLAGASLFFVREPHAEMPARRMGMASSLRYFVKLGRENPDLRRLMGVNVTVGVLGNMLQFYTGYWRHSPGMTVAALPAAIMLATLLQTFWQSGASAILGGVADRRGNRVVICGLLWIEAVIPLSAAFFGGVEPFRSQWGWYLMIYVMVGIRFPVYQLLVNYLLELVPQHDHAMALGAVNTVQIVTAPAPILLGLVASRWGYPTAFVLGSIVGLVGSLSAMRLPEVRVFATPTAK